VGGRGGGGVPDLGDVAGHLTVGEVVKGRVDHLGRGPAERGSAAREVAVPVVAEAQRRHRVVGLWGEEVDQRDRLGELIETAGDWLAMLHLVSSPVIVTAPWRLACHQCYEHAGRHPTMPQRWAATRSARAHAARRGTRG